MRCWCALLVVVWLTGTSAAFAAVQRFAVIVGNNRGNADDVELRYAESDAARVGQVLRDVGGFEPKDIVLLRGEDAGTLESTIDGVNARILAARAAPNTDTLLFVYYSGHADGRTLHLGPTPLELRRLSELVRSSPAKVRLLVVDACRSGTLTRTKGGAIVAPFALPDATLGGEGMALLTASSHGEDAQESDEIRGSFFTHALVSGLLGAADANQDGQVVLEEAYDHAYQATLRATSGTLAGAQHPTFHYDVRGHGSLVLTRLAAATSRGVLVFPKGVSFLVTSEAKSGPVLGEVGSDGARTLSVRPGHYFLRGRGADYLLEGSVAVGPGQRRAIEEGNLERVEYARLVRKGARDSAYAHGPEAGVAIRTALPNASTPCVGGFAGYRVDLEKIGLSTRLGACTSTFENAALKARTNEFGLGLTATRVWDLPFVSAYFGLGLGVTLTHQSFRTQGRAPDRMALAPFGSVVAGAVHPLTARTYLGIEGALEEHLTTYQKTAIAEPELRASTSARGAALAGLQF